MAMKEKGIATLNPGTPDQSWGKCRNIEISDEAEKENLPDGDGDTVGIIYSDIRKKVTAEFTPLAGQTNSPAEDSDLIGKKMSIRLHGTGNAIVIHIDSATHSHEPGKAAKFKIEGYHYPALTDSASAIGDAAGTGGSGD